MSNQTMQDNSHDAIVELVSQAKHRPLPRSTKALTVVVIAAMLFTGGIFYGKHKATSGTGTSLSLAGLTGGGFGGGGFGGGFGGGRNRGANGTSGTSGTLSNGTVSGAPNGFGAPAAAASSDVAGTIVSITPTKVVIQTLAGDKQTFPLLTNTRVRQSLAATLASVKPGDIVTIKPDSSNSAQTITVVK